MKNLLLGISLVVASAAIGQNVASAAPLKKVVRTVKTYGASNKIVRKVEKTNRSTETNTGGKKVYFYLTRMVNKVSEDDYKRAKLTAK